MSRLRRFLARAWALRRWVYLACLLVAIARIPARTGFVLRPPACDARLSLANAQRSLTKVPHVVLFGLFFLVTVLQFDRLDRRVIGWSILATGGLGLLVELEEGATRTGNCRLTDVLPDLAGALLMAALVLAARATHARVANPHAGASRQPPPPSRP
ncbi:MAG TPA: hypothetical protein VGD77_16470 [Gemmatimonadaceae bacterium]